MIRGAIFDIDGTLLDSMPIWSDAGARYLRTRGIAPEEGLGQLLYPMTLEAGAAYLAEHYPLSETPEKVRRGLLRLIGDFYRYEVPLKPGAARLLEALDREGIPMVLATTGDETLAGAALRRLGVDRYFRRTFTCAALHTTKAESRIYRQAAAFLGSRPGETLVFEDMLQAVRAAKGAGFVTVAVQDDSGAAHREALAAEADCYVTDLRDLDIEGLLTEG